MVKALNELVESGEVLVKSFGKINIYIYKEMGSEAQDNDENNDENANDFVLNEETVKKLKEDNMELAKEIKYVTTELGKLKSEITNSELIEEKQELTKKVQSIEFAYDKLEKNESNGIMIDSKAFEIARVRLKRLEIAQRDRWKIQRNIVNAIEEIMDNSEKCIQLFDTLGIDL